MCSCHHVIETLTHCRVDALSLLALRQQQLRGCACPLLRRSPKMRLKMPLIAHPAAKEKKMTPRGTRPYTNSAYQAFSIRMLLVTLYRLRASTPTCKPAATHTQAAVRMRTYFKEVGQQDRETLLRL